MIRRTGLVFGLLIALLALCPLLLAVLPGSWLAKQASGMASAWFDLSVNIEDLTVKPFSLTPTVSIRTLDILAKPESVSLHASKVIVSLSLPALLKGEAVIDRLFISDAALNGRINEQGQANWQMMRDATEPTRAASLLESLLEMKIDDLVLDSIDVQLVNAQLHTQLSLVIEGVASTYDASKLSRGQVTGFADGQSVLLDAEFGFLGDILKPLATGTAPIPMDITASVGDDYLSVKGTVGKPASLRAVDVDFSVRISSLERWQAFFPTRLPDLPLFALAGVVTRDGDDWLLQQVEGQFGSTDFGGEIRADSSIQPMSLDATLMSATLAIDELNQLRKIAFNPLPINGSIDYRAEHVVSDKWPLDSIDLSAVLDERQLSVLINRIKLRGGELDGEIISDLRSQPVVTQVRLNLKRLDLQQLLPMGIDDSLRAGQMAARVELSVAGRTRSSMRGSVDGTLVTLMTGDWLDTLAQSALGVELTQSLMIDREASDKRGQDCAFVELQATEGIVQLRSLVFDTDSIVYLGDGEFDWENQSIDLTIEPHYKKKVVDADAVYVSGALASPVVEPVHPFLTRDSAVSVLDATISSAAALMPFLNDYSAGSDVLCQGLASALDD